MIKYNKVIFKSKYFDLIIAKNIGYEWSSARRQQYANDMSNPDALIAVSNSANRQKGSKDVAEWLPSNEAFMCEYIRRWVGVKDAWGLTMNNKEAQSISELLIDC